MNRVEAVFAVALPASILALSAPAFAQQSDVGWYIGGAYGMTKIEVDMTGISNPVKDESDTGFKIYGGYQFNKNLGAEIGYVDGGKATFSGSGIPVLGIGPFSGDAKATAFTFAAVGTLPLNESFALTGKIGLAAWDSKVSANATGLSGSASDSGTDLLYGVGARYNLNKNWGVTLDYEVVDVSDGSFNMSSLGLRYKF
jgi:OOP family OmpA-OmpF porin